MASASRSWAPVMASAASSSVRNCTAIRTCRVRLSSVDGAARGYGFDRALKRGSRSGGRSLGRADECCESGQSDPLR